MLFWQPVKMFLLLYFEWPWSIGLVRSLMSVKPAYKAVLSWELEMKKNWHFSFFYTRTTGKPTLYESFERFPSQLQDGVQQIYQALQNYFTQAQLATPEEIRELQQLQAPQQPVRPAQPAQPTQPTYFAGAGASLPQSSFIHWMPPVTAQGQPFGAFQQQPAAQPVGTVAGPQQWAPQSQQQSAAQQEIATLKQQLLQWQQWGASAQQQITYLNQQNAQLVQQIQVLQQAPRVTEGEYTPSPEEEAALQQERQARIAAEQRVAALTARITELERMLAAHRQTASKGKQQ